MNINVVQVIVVLSRENQKARFPTPMRPFAFIQPDEILLCCCRVESDLEIEL